MTTDVRAASQLSPPSASTAVRIVAYVAAAWCVGFAAVNAWLLAAGPRSGHVLEDHYAGLVAMSVLVFALKLAGAYLAIASVARRARIPPRLLATALWGASASLVLYSAGNLAITFATTSGLVAPSAAWEAAGGVTVRSLLYVVFFLVGAAMFTVVAVSYHRRHRTRPMAALAGVLGAPAVLAAVLAIAPLVLELLGLLP